MINDTELIEGYFEKSLSEEEKIYFKKRFDTDSEFRNMVEEQGKIVLALRMSASSQNGKSNLRPMPSKKYLWAISGLAAGLALLIVGFIYNEFRYQHKINELKIRYENMLANDMDTIKHQPTQINYETIIPLLAKMTVQDEEDKGESPFRFTYPTRETPSDPDSVTIGWTGLNQTGRIELYTINSFGMFEIIPQYTMEEYDLKTGKITFENLESGKLYLLDIEISFRGKKKVYSFPFITQSKRQ